MTPGAAFVVAAAAAVAYGSATLLQAVSAKRAAEVPSLDPRLLFRLLGSWPYVTGLALDLAGFVATVLALQRLPLFTVQAVGASGVGVTAVLAQRFLRVHLSRSDVAALVVLLAGLVTLCAAAKPAAGAALGPPGVIALLSGFGLLVAIAVLAGQHVSARGGIALAAVTGLAFAGVSIGARGLRMPAPWWHLLFTPAAVAIALYGVLAAVSLPVALQRAPVTKVAAVLLVGETVLPALVGVALLGDGTRGPTGAVAAVVGFALTLGATLKLAQYAAL